MVSIIFIFCGFAVLMLAEWRYVRFSRKSQRAQPGKMPAVLRGHTALQAAGYITVAAGMLISLLHQGVALHIPALVRALSLCIAILGGALLVWTVFIEIPVGMRKHNVEPGCAYRYGSYGMCRHPGFWWFLIFTLGMAFWKSDLHIFLLFFLENALNLLLILLQDKYTFIVQFRDYQEYQKKVPFLLPSPKQDG